MTKKQKNFRLGLFIAYLAIWALLAINPVYREDWLLENILVFVGVPFIVWLDRRTPLSSLSYTLIFLFMVLHTYGSHYTYSETPAGQMVSDWLGLERNHYDRFVHFLWGFLLTIPLFEVFRKKVSRKRLVLDFIFAGSILLTLGVAYEFMEWAAAIVVAPEAGTAFLGTQGDIWDAQKDLLMNVVGTFAAVVFWPFIVKQPKKHENQG